MAPAINEYKDYNLKLIGIFAGNRAEWVAADLMSSLYGNTVVPLYDTYEAENLEYCLEFTNMEVVFCKGENVDILLAL